MFWLNLVVLTKSHFKPVNLAFFAYDTEILLVKEISLETIFTLLPMVIFYSTSDGNLTS